MLTGFWRNETLNDRGKSVYYHGIMNSFVVVKAGLQERTQPFETGEVFIKFKFRKT